MLSNGTTLKIDPPVTAIGAATPVQVRVENPHGIRRLTAIIEQNGTRYTVVDVHDESHRCDVLAQRTKARRFEDFQAGKQQAPALHDGKATAHRRGAVERPARPHGFGRGRRPDRHAAAARQRRRRAALHQPGRLGAGGVYAVGLCDRFRRARGQIRVPQLPASLAAGRSVFRSSRILGICRRTSCRSLCAQPAGTEATARFWYKVFPKKFRSRDFAHRRRVSGQGGEPDRSGRLGRFAYALSAHQRRDAPQEQSRRSRTCASRPRTTFSGPVRFCRLPMPPWNRPSPISAVTSTKARRWMSRCTSASTWP